jgi:uncharacterized membrane-anchored protein
MFASLNKHFSPAYGKPQNMKVPHVTAWFWVAKCCATTVGETISDFFNVLFDPCQCTSAGLGFAALLFFPLLFGVLYVNFKIDYYHPALYWGAIILCSICGTIVTDGFHDNLGVMLWIELIVFFVIMCFSFYSWWKSEGTLDIHSIDTFDRELYYWGIGDLDVCTGNRSWRLHCTAVGNCIRTYIGLLPGFNVLHSPRVVDGQTFWVH